MSRVKLSEVQLIERYYETVGRVSAPKSRSVATCQASGLRAPNSVESMASGFRLLKGSKTASTATNQLNRSSLRGPRGVRPNLSK